MYAKIIEWIDEENKLGRWDLRLGERDLCGMNLGSRKI